MAALGLQFGHYCLSYRENVLIACLQCTGNKPTYCLLEYYANVSTSIPPVSVLWIRVNFLVKYPV